MTRAAASLTCHPVRAPQLTVLPPSHGARSKFAQVKRRFVFAVVDAQRSVVTGYAPSPADPDTGAIGTMEVWSIAFPAGDVIATSSQVDLGASPPSRGGAAVRVLTAAGVICLVQRTTCTHRHAFWATSRCCSST